MLIYKPEYFTGEFNTSESECVPNQAITAKEAVERALRNIPVPSRMTYEQSQQYYDGKEDEIDLDSVGSEPHFDNEMDVMDWHSQLQSQLKKNVPAAPVPPSPTPPAGTVQEKKPEQETPPNAG